MFHIIIKLCIISSTGHQSSLESMSSMGEPTPTSVYWKDDNVKDEGAPDPRTVQFRPGRKPGIHLGRLSWYYLF